jgi:hypothetical protein
VEDKAAQTRGSGPHVIDRYQRRLASNGAEHRSLSHSAFGLRHSSFVIRHSSFVIRH